MGNWGALPGALSGEVLTFVLLLLFFSPGDWKCENCDHNATPGRQFAAAQDEGTNMIKDIVQTKQSNL